MSGRYTTPEPVRVERWRDVPGYDGKYQASTEGNIRRKLPDGTMVPVTIYDNRGYRKNYCTVILTRPDGRRQEKPVLRVVAETWFPGQLQDRRAAHRNGLKSDNSVWNVVLVTRETIMRRVGGQYGRKAVLHYKKWGVCGGLSLHCRRQQGHGILHQHHYEAMQQRAEDALPGWLDVRLGQGVIR